MAQPIDKEVKEQVLARVAKGESMSEVSAEYGISAKTVSKWVKDAKSPDLTDSPVEPVESEQEGEDSDAPDSGPAKSSEETDKDQPKESTPKAKDDDQREKCPNPSCKSGVLDQNGVCGDCGFDKTL